ncbi:MAG: hypothetical protein JZU65_13865 [Chlorobium sp.]|nr:hypothetical protein [Chlorobium sp.]
MNIKTKRVRFLFLTVLLVALVDSAILRWYFPVTEGWWETYAWLMENGQNLYSDIWVSHPPLHILLMRAQMAFVGHDFLLLRLVGVVTHGVTVSLLYLWLERLTTPFAAFCGALLSTLLIIYPNSVYIVRDYHTTVEFFEVLALLCLTPVLFQSRVDTIPSFRLNRSVILGILGTGVACGSLFLVKQNIGVFFTAFIGLAFFLRALDGRLSRTSLQSALLAESYFVLGIFVLPALVTICIGSDWLTVYVGNRSKGNVSLVLTRFLVDEESRKIFFGAIIASALFIRCRLIESLSAIIADHFKMWGTARVFLSPIACRVIFFIAGGYFLKLAPSHYVFSLSLAWLAYRAVHARDELSNIRVAWYEFGWLPLIGLAYCGTHTAGYNFVGMQLILALMIADIAYCCYEQYPTIRNDRKIALTGFGIVLIVIGLKLAGPIYNWWGLKEGGVFGSKYSLPFDELRGFRVGKPTADIFNTLAEYKTTLSEKDSIFAYPSIPIVYLLLNKKPPIKLPTLWFDVSDRSQLENVVRDLEHMMPSLIFWLKPPDFVYNGHANLRRLPSLISGVDDWLYKKITSCQYQIEQVIPIDLDDSWKANNPDFHKTITAQFFVGNSGLKCKQIRHLNGVTETTGCIDEDTVSPGSTISVNFSNRYWLNKNMGVIGFPYSTNDSYTFIVLKRKLSHEGTE